MGIDIYVGSLTRYVCNDWETSQQRANAAIGLGKTVVMQVSPDGSAGPRRATPVRQSGRIGEAIKAYRASIVRGMKNVSTAATEWDESTRAPCFVETPRRSGWGGLLLFAAYDQRPDLMPASLNVEDPSADPALRAVADDLAGPYCHLVTGVTCWLPFQFPQPVMAPSPRGGQWRLGSVSRLLAQLARLNSRGWNAGPPEIEAWAAGKTTASTEFERSAQFGFAILQKQAERAIAGNLPMVLDF